MMFEEIGNSIFQRTEVAERGREHLLGFISGHSSWGLFWARIYFPQLIFLIYSDINYYFEFFFKGIAGWMTRHFPCRIPNAGQPGGNFLYNNLTNHQRRRIFQSIRTHFNDFPQKLKQMPFPQSESLSLIFLHSPSFAVLQTF